MKKLILKSLCGFLAALLLTGMSMASNVRVASSLYSVNSVATAVSAVQEQLDGMLADGLIDTAEGVETATQCAEFAIYCSAVQDIGEADRLIIDREALSELAKTAAETRDKVIAEFEKREAQTLCDLPVAVKFVTPISIAIELYPDSLDTTPLVELIVVETAHYQLKIRLSELAANLREPLQITLRDVGESDVKMDVQLSDENLSGYMTRMCKIFVGK